MKKRGRKRGHIVSLETREKIRKAMTGRKASRETKEKMRKTALRINSAQWLPVMRGAVHPNWKGGKTPKNTQLRNDKKYRKWRLAVFKRDNYTCQICGKRGGYLQADHLKSFADFPRSRFLLENGRTLCFQCHYRATWSKEFSGEASDIYKFYPSLR